MYERLNRYGYRCVPPIRVALTLDQALGLPESYEELDLSDKVHRRFHHVYPQLGGGTHIEALPGAEIQRVVKEAVQARVDVPALNESIAVTRAVRAFLTEHTQEAIRYYEQRQLGQSLDNLIREPGVLVNEYTGEPFSSETLERYLAEEDDEDEDAAQGVSDGADAPDDDATGAADIDADASDDDEETPEEKAAWDAYYVAAYGDPPADPAEVERLRDVWSDLRAKRHDDEDEGTEEPEE